MTSRNSIGLAVVLVSTSLCQTTAQNIPSVPLPGGRGLERAEYYFDQDPGLGLGTELDVDHSLSVTELTFDAFAEELGPGLHNLFVRLIDSAGEWSVPIKHPFFVLPYATATLPKLQSGAWSVDQPINDDSRLIEAEDATSDAASFRVGTFDLEPGGHQVTVRYQDELGNWGLPETHNFMVIPRFDVTQARMTVFENQNPIGSTETSLSEADLLSPISVTSTSIVREIPDSSFSAEIQLIFNDTIPWVKIFTPFELSDQPPLSLGFVVGLGPAAGGEVFSINLPQPFDKAILIEQSEDLQTWKTAFTIAPGEVSFQAPYLGSKRFFRATVLEE